MPASDINPMIFAERDAIARMLISYYYDHTREGDEAEGGGDERLCTAHRAVAANLRRLAAWIKQGEHHNY